MPSVPLTRFSLPFRGPRLFSRILKKLWETPKIAQPGRLDAANLAQKSVIRLYSLVHPKFPQEADFIPTHARDVVVVGDALGEEPVADLPGEDGGALPLVVGDLGDDRGRRHARLRAPDRPRLDRPSLVVPARHK